MDVEVQLHRLVTDGYVAWRATKGKEDRTRRHERSGLAGKPRPDGPMIWAHAASVGETIAIIPLIESILDFGVNVVLTTGTITSAQVADDRLGDRIIHQFVPLDLRPAITRFLNHWQPDLAEWLYKVWLRSESVLDTVALIHR